MSVELNELQKMKNKIAIKENVGAALAQGLHNGAEELQAKLPSAKVANACNTASILQGNP
jgi:hypothetical protein